MLNMDTTAPSILPVVEANRYLFMGFDQLPVWVLGEERKKTITTANGVRWYYLDTLVSQVDAVGRLDSGYYRPLKQIRSTTEGDYFESDWVVEADNYTPLAAKFWADSIAIYPTPVHTTSDNSTDTLEVTYWVRTSTNDTTAIALPREYQEGVLLYALWRAEKRFGMGRDVAAWNDYEKWAARMGVSIVNKPRDPLRDER